MNETYLKLFSEIAHAAEILAEQVMELDMKKGDSKGEKTAATMRQDYQQLYDKLRNNNFELTKAEFAKILVGALIVSQQIENQIEAHKKALQGYKVDVIPKLQRIIDEADSDEKALALAKEIFQVIDENK